MMPVRLLAALACASFLAFAADAPLPELRIEPKTAGSIFHVRNTSTQPLTAYLIELVDYPGSSYQYWQDDPANPLAPGAATRIDVVNMTVGAVPDYVKMRAAVYADGTAAGVPEKVTLLLGRRKAVLATTRELIQRIEKASNAAAAKADLEQWAGSLPAISRVRRFRAEGIDQAASAALIADTAKALGAGDTAPVLARLRASEKSLASARPPL
jgi:hypothetical protein